MLGERPDAKGAPVSEHGDLHVDSVITLGPPHLDLVAARLPGSSEADFDTRGDKWCTAQLAEGA